jgi:hypothetical protein
MFGITTSYSTGLPALDAREDFDRARRSRLTAQVGHCITGRLSRERRPRWLLAPAALAAGTARLEVVTLDSIVGTVKARTDFDARSGRPRTGSAGAGSGSRSRTAPEGRCRRSPSSAARTATT